MKALVSAFALLSFVAATTIPYAPARALDTTQSAPAVKKAPAKSRTARHKAATHKAARHKAATHKAAAHKAAAHKATKNATKPM